MNSRMLIMVSGFLLMATLVAAQKSEPIRTWRPGQGIGPFGVGQYMLQTQTGLDIGGFSKLDEGYSGKSVVPSTVMRFGITNKVEINVAYEVRRDLYKVYDSVSTTSGLSVNSIGSFINLYEGKGREPNIGLQVAFNLPLVSGPYKARYAAPKIVLSASKSLSNKFSLLLNSGIIYNGNNEVPTGLYVANVGYSISPKWGAFVENYGTLTGGIFEHRWDGGFAYLHNNDLQLDVYGGSGYNYHQSDYFVSVGVSWRIPVF